MKRILSSVSVILVLVMLLSMAAPLTAFAAGDEITVKELTAHIYSMEAEVKNADGTYTITNSKGTMVIDPEKEALHFDSFEDFISAKENADGTELDAPYIRE